MPAGSKRGRRGAPKRKIHEVIEVEEPPAKVYNNPWERDTDMILDFVKTAGDRGFPFDGPESNLRMMKLCAAPALSETREDRHRNQAIMVDLMDKGLLDIETRMNASLAESKERLASADAIQANLEQIKTSSEQVLESKAEILRMCREKNNEKKIISAEKKKVADEARKELKVRQKSEGVEQAVLDALNTAYDVEFKILTEPPAPPAPVEPVAPVEGEAPAVEGELEKKMEEVEIVEEPAPVPKKERRGSGRGRRASIPKEPTKDDRIERILEQMRLHGADESLMQALPHTLRIALDGPKGFDFEVMNACTKFFFDKRQWAEGNLTVVKTSVQEQQAKLQLAENEQEAAYNEQAAAKEGVTAAQEEWKTATKDLKQKELDIKEHLSKDVETRTRVGDMAGWLTEIGMAIRMFGMLRDRCHPPPVVEEPAPVEEAAPMEEVAAHEPMEIAAPVEIAM